MAVASEPISDQEVRQFRANQRRLLRLMLAISRFHHKVTGMGSLELHVLQLLGERERLGEAGTIARDLAEVLRVDKAALSRAVANLTKGKLVESQSDPQDARRQTLLLTQKGREMAGEMDAAAQTANKMMLEWASPKEREAIALGLETFVVLVERALEMNADEVKNQNPK